MALGHALPRRAERPFEEFLPEIVNASVKVAVEFTESNRVGNDGYNMTIKLPKLFALLCVTGLALVVYAALRRQRRRREDRVVKVKKKKYDSRCVTV
jgi:uncharacterized membrane protein YidH (DUF202 family)